MILLEALAVISPKVGVIPEWNLSRAETLKIPIKVSQFRGKRTVTMKVHPASLNFDQS